MDTIELESHGPAVEDVQRRLSKLGYDLGDSGISGDFDGATAEAVRKFRQDRGLPEGNSVDAITWAALVDASYSFGDRTLYLKMPYFHGNDVRELQQILNILGFACGPEDSIFGAYTERGVRDFQLNMGIEPDGIVGISTYKALTRLHRSWKEKDPLPEGVGLGFSRAAEVLENHAVCVYGVDEPSREIASRISNLAFATTFASKVVSADKISGAPTSDMMMVEITTGDVDTESGNPVVIFDDPKTLGMKFRAAVSANPKRLVVKIEEPDESQKDIQHNAIVILDAICVSY